MLNELLVLSVLLNQECTIYKIRKIINKYFFVFCRPSFGSICPTLDKLLENKYVKVKKSMSPGGQKSSLYSITTGGKKYFAALMREELPQNPPAAEQLANVKIMLLSQLAKPQKLQVLSILKDYYQSRLLDFENFSQELKDNEKTELKNIGTGFIKYNIDSISEKLNWVEFQELSQLD